MPIVWVFTILKPSRKYYFIIQRFIYFLLITFFKLSSSFSHFYTYRKSNELLRLINLKLSSTITNQTAKWILSIDCASIVCGTDLDHRQAVKLSGLKESDYNRQKDLVEKVLNLRKQLTLDEICAQLEINERSKNDARQLFNEYVSKNSFYDDTNSAPILVMAIHQSLKLRKMKNSSAIKSKLMQLSKLKSKEWKQLEEEWDNWIEKFKPLKAVAAATNSQKTHTGSDRHQNESTGKFTSKNDGATRFFKLEY